MLSIRCLIQFLRTRAAEVKELIYDKILGIETRADYPLDFSIDNDINPYSPSFYGRLEKMAGYLKFNSDDVFVDFGCGKGRTIFFVAAKKIKKVIGIELDKKLVDIANKNLKCLRFKKTPVEIIHTDAGNFNPIEGTIFFMFNPFRERTITKVVDNIRKSLIANPRKIRIVYYAPAHSFLLDSQNWLIREGEIEDSNCLVWRGIANNCMKEK